MHENRSAELFRWSTVDFKFDKYFLRIGGTLKQGAITHSANELFSWEHLKMCSGDPRLHVGTHLGESLGGGHGEPSLLPD